MFVDWPMSPPLDPEVKAIFSERNVYRALMDFEVALAQAQAEVGMIPSEAAKEIKRAADPSKLDFTEIRKRGRERQHYPLAFIYAFSGLCEGGAGEYIHWGSTSQNLTQTAQILLMKQAHRAILRKLRLILDELGKLAERYQTTVMAGRTHGQHALPITFGFKVAVWIDQLCRHEERLLECEKRVFVGLVGGAVGTSASLGPLAMQVQNRTCEILGLGSMAVPARNITDHLVEYVLILAMLSASLGMIAREVYMLMKDEVREVDEHTEAGVVGSSTMPQKDNPNYATEAIAYATQAKAMATMALDAVVVDHEADMTQDYVKDKACFEACMLTASALDNVLSLVQRIRVYPQRMLENLDRSNGAILGEAVMIELAKHVGRQTSHKMLFAVAHDCKTNGKTFREALLSSQAILSYLSEARVSELLDPAHYVGLSARYAAESAARAKMSAQR